MLRERIGGGAYGDVYRAYEARLDREVALKLLRSDPAGEDSSGQDVIEEARLLARVRHPHVVTVYGADRHDDRVGLWMELIHGRPLDRDIVERGPQSAQEAAVVGLAVCEGLAAVHQAGLVHRDVKAGNVMREDAGRIVLMDFGTGCPLADPKYLVRLELVGTPLYAAPEIFEGRPATPASDLYGVGVLLYYLVTGFYPTAGATTEDVREAHQRGERRPLRDARPDLPAAFVAVVERALSADPHDRFSSAGAMEAALAAALVGQEASRVPVAAPASGGEAPAVPVRDAAGHSAARGRRLRAAVTAAVLVSLGLLAYRYWPRAGQAGAEVGFQPRDWVLVTAFDNRTGVATLDGTVEHALERELEVSRFVNVVARERAGDALALMRKPPDTRVDESIGREICLRDGGIRAMVAGRVEKLGSVFNVSARVVDPGSGRTLMHAAVDAASEERILQVVRELSNRIRASLGESRRQIAATDQALEKATTPSLKALQLYSQGMALITQLPARDGEWRTARSLFERAIEEDPEFASAYVYLSWSWQRGMPWADRAKQRAAAERALELSQHATERERLFIRATYFQLHERREEARAAYEALVRLYPDHYWAVNNLLRLSGPDEALPYVLRLAELRPKGYRESVMAVESLIRAGRAGEAGVYVETARANLRASGVQPLYWLECFPIWQRWVSGDVAGAMTILREMAEAADRDGNAGLRRALNIWLLVFGRLREADTLWEARLADLDRSGENPAGRGAPLPEVMPEILLAWNAELRGDREAARRWMRQMCSRITPKDRVYWWEAVFMPARAGLGADVRQMLAQPAPSWLQEDHYVSWVRGELALAEGRPAEAATQLARAFDVFASSYITRFLGIQSLSAALETTRGPQAALEVIEKNLYPQGRSHWQYLNLSAWLDLQARRARLLREVGRPAEAESIEAELRKYLAYADPDMVIVKQLAKTPH